LNHFRKDNAIPETHRIVDKKVDKAGSQNNPGPVNGVFLFHEYYPLIFHPKKVFETKNIIRVVPMTFRAGISNLNVPGKRANQAISHFLSVALAHLLAHRCHRVNLKEG